MEQINRDDSITMDQTLLLHSRADRALRLVVARQLDQYNVTMMEWLLMSVVLRGDDGGMTMSAVAAALDVTLPQVTALTASLTKLKFLKQKISRQDRRSRRLAVTNAGKKLLSEIEGQVNQAMQDWTADIPDQQFKAYLNTLEILAGRKPGEAVK